MTAQEELESIVQQAKAYDWTPELFDRCQRVLGYADVFNVLRRELLPDEYEQFDFMYCDRIRPQDRELNKWLRETHRKEGDERWKTMSHRDLQNLSDRKLLELLKKLKDENEL